MKLLLASAAAYLLGAIPFGLLLSRTLGNRDPREFGSGNIGATNVLRTSGRLVGALTLFADVAKGAIPVAIAIGLSGSELIIACVALAAFLGHIFPIYLKFQGGKGVATMFGVILPWQPLIAVAAFAFWLLVLAVGRYVSLASILSGASMPLFAWLLDASTAGIITTLLLAVIMIIRHSNNIRRLLAHEEPTIHQDKKERMVEDK
ncbi:MAG: glycerol-3-phosphate 1-O-acyltransferase PlsY [Mariprofundaceae bacterium]